MKINMKKLVLFAVMCVVTVVVIIAAAVLMKPQQEEFDDVIVKENRQTVSVITVEPRNLDDIVSIIGIMTPFRSVSEPVEQTGKVAEIMFEEGDFVNEGDVLLKIEDDTYRFRYEQQKVSYEKAKSDFERWDKLKKSGSVSENVLDEKRTDMETARWSYEQTKLALEQCTVRASISGVIQEKFVEKGEYVNPGMVVAEIKDLSILKLEVKIPEKDIFSVKEGEIMTFSVDALDEKEFTGTVTFVAPESDRKSNTFRVELEYDNSEGILKPGIFVRLKFIRNEFRNAIVVPLSALVVDKGYYIAYTEEDGEAVRNVVRLKQIVDSQAVIRSGLKVGDHLIVKGQRLVSDGAAVEVVDEKISNSEN